MLVTSTMLRNICCEEWRAVRIFMVGYILSMVLSFVCVHYFMLFSQHQWKALSEIVKCVRGCGAGKLKKQNHNLNPDLSGSKVSTLFVCVPADAGRLLESCFHRCR